MSDAPEIPVPATDLFIGGKWVPASPAAASTCSDPATGEVIAIGRRRHASTTRSPRSTRPTPPRPGWAATAPRERAEILRRRSS